ncbi:MAG TPA: hypothetical protein VH374_21230 [Polyangia bacterium]|jgi:hypothetical protein|nr:hypothetical protein [Polyangia bacterium]
MPDKKPTLFERAQRAEQNGNRETRDLWDLFRSHRQRVTAEILALAPGDNDASGGRLCLLGAGNANDLDLQALAARFDEIHLVDIDPGALSRATGRQSPAVRARLRSHAPVDLSGLYHQLERRSRLPSTDEMVAAGTAAVMRQLPSEFDVVASCCVLSQMSWALERLASTDGTRESTLEKALLRIHLRAILRMIRPTGAALLVSDLTSSQFYPSLGELSPGEDLRALTQRLAAQRVAFTVCNPELVRQTLRHDAELAETCLPPTMGDPWLWTAPKALTYLVYPFVLRRKS